MLRPHSFKKANDLLSVFPDFERVQCIPDGDMTHFIVRSVEGKYASQEVEKILARIQNEVGDECGSLPDGEFVYGFDCEFNHNTDEKRNYEHVGNNKAKQIVMTMQFSSMYTSIIFDLESISKNSDTRLDKHKNWPKCIVELFDYDLTCFAIEGDIGAIASCWPDFADSEFDNLRYDMVGLFRYLGCEYPSLKHVSRLLFDFDVEKNLPVDWSRASYKQLRDAGRDAILSKRAFMWHQFAEVDKTIPQLKAQIRVWNKKQDIAHRRHRIVNSKNRLLKALLNDEECTNSDILVGELESLLTSMKFDRPKMTYDDLYFKEKWKITMTIVLYCFDGKCITFSENIYAEKTENILTKREQKGFLRVAIAQLLGTEAKRVKFRDALRTYQ